MNRAFTSSCEASGSDPSSPLSYSVLDVPTVCSEPDWHLSPLCSALAGFARPALAHSIFLLTQQGGPLGAFLPLGKQQSWRFDYKD